MKNQDKITQVYQDALKDLAVEAPASIQANALREINRTSLLTLDPTRLNVFYLALISGIVAWSILGEDRAVTAQFEPRSQEVLADVDQTTELDVLVDQNAEFIVESEESKTTADLIEVPVQSDSKQNYHNVKETKETPIEPKSSIENLESFFGNYSAMGNGDDGREPILHDEIIDVKEEIVEAEVNEPEIDDRERTSVDGLKVQPADKLLKSSKFDSDKKLRFKFFRKKSK